MKNLQRMFLVGAVALTTMHAGADIASLEHALATCRAHIAAGKLISGEDVVAVEALVDLADAVGQDNLSASHTQALGEVLVWAAQAEPETRNKLNKIFNNVFIRGLLEVNSLAVDADAAVGGDLTVDGNITLKGQLFTQSTSGAIPIEVIDGDTGSVTGQTIQFTALPTAGQTVSFDGSGSTMTLNLSSGGNTFLGTNVGTPASGAFTGTTNIAIGSDVTTMSSLTSGFSNIAIGYHAAEELSDGTGNVCIGVFAGQDLSTGSYNICLGNSSGFNIGAGANNTYIGYHAGQASVGGNSNVFVGYNAGGAATSTNPNVFVGTGAGEHVTTGGNNTLLGTLAGSTMTTGINNVAIGNLAWTAATAGDDNTIVGDIAGVNLLTGRANIIVGQSAGSAYTGAESFNTVIGAPGKVGESNVVRIGAAGALSYLDDANEAIFIGRTAGTGTYTVGTPIVSIGDGAANSVTTGGGVFVGHNAGAVVTTGAQNTLIGNEAGSAVSTAAGNTFVGYNAGHLNTAANNTFVGASAGAAVTSGSQNVIVGSAAGSTLTTSTGNTLLGYNAGHNLTGAANTIVGAAAGGSGISGFNNIVIGDNEAQNLTSGYNNIVIGAGPGLPLATGINNVIIGTTFNSVATAGVNDFLLLGSGGVSNGGGSPTTYITGLYATTNPTPTNGLAVSSNGALGQTGSSLRFKENVRTLGDEVVSKLRPVEFTYKLDEDHSVQYGLIAEEVAEVLPGLVGYNAKNEPITVHYHMLPSILLAGIKNLYARVEQLEAQQK